jgi:peptide deformylase
MVYPIRLYGDPVLRQRAQVIRDLDASVAVPRFPQEPLHSLADHMLETMYEARGVGLAAPQIGLPIRLFVAAEYADDEEEAEESPRSGVLREWVMINPKLERVGRQRSKDVQEGCLSIPNIYEEGVPRHLQLRVRYQDLSGREQVAEVEGHLARVFQHEADHLDGVLFLDYLSTDVVAKYRQELAALKHEALAALQTQA